MILLYDIQPSSSNIVKDGEGSGDWNEMKFVGINVGMELGRFVDSVMVFLTLCFHGCNKFSLLTVAE
jgi:hypothetical protein